MTGPAWALVAGLSFGLFQVANRAAVASLGPRRSMVVALWTAALFVSGIAGVDASSISTIRALTAHEVLVFVGAGILHFVVGWSFLTRSQQVAGAVLTAPLVNTAPVLGAVGAALLIAEYGDPMLPVAALSVTGGVWLTARGRLRGGNPSVVAVSGSLRKTLPGMGAATCWAISAIVIRSFLRSELTPLPVVAMALVAAAIAYLPLYATGAESSQIADDRSLGNAVIIALLAGVLMGLGTLSIWSALSMSPVAIALSVNTIQVPTTMLVAPLLLRQQEHRASPVAWLGTGVIVTASIAILLR